MLFGREYATVSFRSRGGVAGAIRVLRYFLAAVQEESITRAADVLPITQPALSRQIARMEEEMGVRLFDRGTRKISLASEGLLLRRRAEEILELVDKTQKELAEQDKLVEGTVAIGCGDLAAVQMLPELLRRFHERYPVVSFDLYTATADHIKDRMDRRLVLAKGRGPSLGLPPRRNSRFRPASRCAPRRGRLEESPAACAGPGGGAAAGPAAGCPDTAAAGWTGTRKG